MDAVTESAVGQLGDHRLQVLELSTQRGPAIDHEEHVTERILGEPAEQPGPAVGSDALHGVAGEQRFAGLQQSVHLRDGAAHRVHLAAVGHAADVWQARHG